MERMWITKEMTIMMDRMETITTRMIINQEMLIRMEMKMMKIKPIILRILLMDMIIQMMMNRTVRRKTRMMKIVTLMIMKTANLIRRMRIISLMKRITLMMVKLIMKRITLMMVKKVILKIRKKMQIRKMNKAILMVITVKKVNIRKVVMNMRIKKETVNMSMTYFQHWEVI